MCSVRSFKVVNGTRSSRKEVYVSSLNQLIRDASEKFGLTGVVKIVLENDGTIVDDEEYFATLEQNTNLMILKSDESWSQSSNPDIQKDEVDFHKFDLNLLLERLKTDFSQIVMLNDKELELISDAQVDAVGDIQDKNFFRNIQEACSLYLHDRREAKDHMQLMRLYHKATHSSDIK